LHYLAHGPCPAPLLLLACIIPRHNTPAPRHPAEGVDREMEIPRERHMSPSPHTAAARRREIECTRLLFLIHASPARALINFKNRRPPPLARLINIHTRDTGRCALYKILKESIHALALRTCVFIFNRRAQIRRRTLSRTRRAAEKL
jgi:hypothetical protein